MRNQLAVLAILLSIVFSSSAQESGTVVLLTKPPIGATIAKIGDTLVQHQTKLVLPAGTYELTLWAPYYETIKKTIVVVPNETITIREKLAISKEVQDYRQALSDYNHLVIRKKVVPYASTGLLVAGSTIAWIRARRYQKEAFEWKEKYEHTSSTAQIIDYERRFAESKKRSKNGKVTLCALGGLSVGACYFSWKGYNFMKSVERPVLPTPQRPLELSGVSLGLDGVGLTLNF